MKVVIGGRQGGKTTKIIEAYNRGDIQKIVVANVQMQQHLVSKYFVKREDIYTPQSAYAMRGTQRDYGIDDFDLMSLGNLIPPLMMRPTIVTMTGEAIMLPDPRKGGNDE